MGCVMYLIIYQDGTGHTLTEVRTHRGHVKAVTDELRKGGYIPEKLTHLPAPLHYVVIEGESKTNEFSA